jgi:hypothetical protein
MSQIAEITSTEVREQVLAHLLALLARTEVIDEPFTHAYLEQVFPEALYDDLLAALPETERYDGGRKKSNDGYSMRYNFQLNRENLSRLEEPSRSLWTGASQALYSPEFQRALLEKLAMGLTRRFSIDRDRVGQVAVWPRAALYRDLPGYEIAPHPDTRRKIITMQLFLPPDDARQYLGTCLYRQRLVQGLLGRGRFERFKQFPFRRNSGYVFVVCNSPLRPKSWHGCEKTPSEGGLRDTLLHIYYDEPVSHGLDQSPQRSR